MGCDVTIINDLVAQAWAIPALMPDELRILNEGTSRPDRPALVIGPGTGLGIAFLLSREDTRPYVLPSEGGHASFAPEDKTDLRIWAHLKDASHVSIERLVSGPGLLTVAKVLAEINGTALEVNDPRDVSAQAAKGCPHCIEATRRVSGLLGATEGNVALTMLTEGGVFITDGLCRNLGSLLDGEALSSSFTSKGRFRPLLKQIPVYQVLRPHVGLLGTSLYIHEDRGHKN